MSHTYIFIKKKKKSARLLHFPGLYEVSTLLRVRKSHWITAGISPVLKTRIGGMQGKARDEQRLTAVMERNLD